MEQQTRTAPTKGAVALPVAMDYLTLLTQIGDKYRQSMEKQVLAYETKLGAAAADRWRRLAGSLLSLAPQAPKLTGMHIMQFFIPDGKYRKQVMALHAVGDGTLAVYARNILDEAVRKGILAKPRIVDGDTACSYPLPRSTDALKIESLDGKTCNPSAFYKDMTGWNRKAMCITLALDASDAQVEVTERLCGLAAAEWAGK